MIKTEFFELSTDDKLKLLRACDGVHATMDELFECESCDTLFHIMDDYKEQP